MHRVDEDITQIEVIKPERAAGAESLRLQHQREPLALALDVEVRCGNVGHRELRVKCDGELALSAGRNLANEGVNGEDAVVEEHRLALESCDERVVRGAVGGGGGRGVGALRVHQLVCHVEVPVDVLSFVVVVLLPSVADGVVAAVVHRHDPLALEGDERFGDF